MVYYLIALTLISGSGSGPAVKFEGQSYTWRVVDVYTSLTNCDKAAADLKKNKSTARYICAEKDYN